MRCLGACWRARSPGIRTGARLNALENCSSAFQGEGGWRPQKASPRCFPCISLILYSQQSCEVGSRIIPILPMRKQDFLFAPIPSEGLGLSSGSLPPPPHSPEPVAFLPHPPAAARAPNNRSQVPPPSGSPCCPDPTRPASLLPCQTCFGVFPYLHCSCPPPCSAGPHPAKRLLG